MEQEEPWVQLKFKDHAAVMFTVSFLIIFLTAFWLLATRGNRQRLCKAFFAIEGSSTV